MIVNGDFQAGSTGFISDYSPTAGIGSTEGTYAVLSDPHGPAPYQNPFGVSYYDHTYGDSSGLMMAVNGSPTPGELVWGQVVTHLIIGHQYQFSLWLSTWSQIYNDSSAVLGIQMNGITEATFDAPSTAGVWQQYSLSWTAASSTVALAAIFDDNTAVFGNDFALDDIALEDATGSVSALPVPDSLPAICNGLPLLLLGIERVLRRRPAA